MEGFTYSKAFNTFPPLIAVPFTISVSGGYFVLATTMRLNGGNHTKILFSPDGYNWTEAAFLGDSK